MDAVEDERAALPPDSGEPAHDPETETRGDSDAPEAVETADPRTTIAGRYQVDLREAPAEAGIAAVYQGRDLRTREPIVVKTLRLEYRGDPEMRARFRREARLLQFLSHPNVIRALTFTEERGAPWLVLERVRGRSLREIIAADAPLSPEAVVPLLQGIAAALDHLHARGLVHLDVRPENIMVTPEGVVKLVDFGVAQAAGATLDAADSAGANPAYLAPEQTCGEPIDTATDVYALGSVVYELLTGTPPFSPNSTSADRNAAIRSRLEQAPRPLTLTGGGTKLPSWVDDVVLGALERDPRLRYSSAGSFAAIFHAGVEGEVDVETGRPRLRPQPARSRQVPTNEPAIATKGSPRLASRRGEAALAPLEASEPAVVDASFSARAAPNPVAIAGPARGRGLDLDALGRRLWQAVFIAAALNLLLMIALVITRGALPGIWSPDVTIGPGVSVRVAGAGLVARAEPDIAAPIVADLPEGGNVHISGDVVQGADGLPWWPIEVETESGTVSGYVPESWIQEP